LIRFLQIIQIVIAVALIFTILRQPGKADGFNLISSSGETFYSKNKTKTYESFLARLTVILAVAFAVVTSVLTIIK
jgi:preprotein translocase subunit SecG